MFRKFCGLTLALALSTACTTIPLKDDYRVAGEKTVGTLVGDLPAVEYDNSTGAGDGGGLIGVLVASAVEAIDSAVRTSDDKLKEVTILAEDSKAFRDNIRKTLESDKVKVEILSASEMQALPKNASKKSGQAELDFTSLDGKKVNFAFVIDDMRLGVFGRKHFQPCLLANAYIVRVSDNTLMFRDRFESCATAPDGWRDGDLPAMKAMIISATQVFIDQLKQKLAASTK